jgi:hypothetical protein
VQGAVAALLCDIILLSVCTTFYTGMVSLCTVLGVMFSIYSTSRRLALLEGHGIVHRMGPATGKCHGSFTLCYVMSRHS